MLVHIQCGGVLLHHHIRDKDRVVGNIASSQVQKPGHFIQGGYQKRPSTFLCMYNITLPLCQTGWASDVAAVESSCCACTYECII